MNLHTRGLSSRLALAPNKPYCLHAVMTTPKDGHTISHMRCRHGHSAQPAVLLAQPQEAPAASQRQCRRCGDGCAAAAPQVGGCRLRGAASVDLLTRVWADIATAKVGQAMALNCVTTDYTTSQTCVAVVATGAGRMCTAIAEQPSVHCHRWPWREMMWQMSDSEWRRCQQTAPAMPSLCEACGRSTQRR